MINVVVNKNEVNVKELKGDRPTIMVELCCLVKSVCMGFCADKKDCERMSSAMVLAVADGIKFGEKIKWGEDFEDDENADF